jgi:HK97 family phage major capsid protein
MRTKTRERVAKLKQYGAAGGRGESDPYGGEERVAMQARHKAITDARAIVDQANAARRDLNASESSEFDRLMDEADKADRWLREERGLTLDYTRDEWIPAGADAGGPGGPDAGPVFELADGRRIRGLRHGDSFAQAHAADPRTYGTGEWGQPAGGGDRNGPDAARADKEMLGRVLAAAVTGQWDLVPSGQRDQLIASDPAGGFFLGPQISAMLIDEARAASVLSQAGAITLPMTGPHMQIVRVTGSPSARWKAERQPLHNTSVKLGAINLFPKVLGAIVDLSVELVQDARNASQAIQRVLIEAVRDQLDRSLFRGITWGGDESLGRPFKGVLDEPGVNIRSMGDNGAQITDYDPYVDAVTMVEESNGLPDVRIDHPRTAGALAKLRVTENGQYLQPPELVAELRHLKSTQLPTDMTHGSADNATAAVVGNFGSAFVILGVRSEFRIEASREAGDAFERLGVKVRVWGRYDLAVGRPDHLSVVQGIIPAGE